jgi:RNA polymerase sigma factor (sigma-70 family)
MLVRRAQGRTSGTSVLGRPLKSTIGTQVSFVATLKAGAPAAWDRAFETLYPVAYAVAESRLKATLPGDCEDVAIETLAELIETDLTQENEKSLKPLVAAIARNKATDRLRKHLASKRGGNNLVSLDDRLMLPGGEAILISEEDFLDRLTVRELRDLLVALSAEINQSYRVILHDFYLAELSYEEIAAKRKISINSVGVYLKRALDALRSVLERTPKLKQEMLQTIGNAGSAKLLLPFLPILLLGRSLVEQTIFYSPASPASLSDEDRLRSTSESDFLEVPIPPDRRNELIRRAAENFPAGLERWKNWKRAKETRDEALLRALKGTSLCTPLLLGLAIPVLLGVALSLLWW